MTKDESLKLALEALEYHTAQTRPIKQTNEAITAIKEALAQPEQCQCPNCKVTLHASDCAVHNEPAYPKGECNCWAQQYNATSDNQLMENVQGDLERIKLVQMGVGIGKQEQEPEFFTHNVEQPHDWSEWVCPDPKGYLMKCCDCGLVHEAEFGVVRYKSETEREDCEPVDDPNLQAVFRMRRSEQWSPADMAHRAGGLTMEQPAQRIWVGLTDEEVMECLDQVYGVNVRFGAFAEVIEAKLKEKNT